MIWLSISRLQWPRLSILITETNEARNSFRTYVNKRMTSLEVPAFRDIIFKDASSPCVWDCCYALETRVSVSKIVTNSKCTLSAKYNLIHWPKAKQSQGSAAPDERTQCFLGISSLLKCHTFYFYSAQKARSVRPLRRLMKNLNILATLSYDTMQKELSKMTHINKLYKQLHQSKSHVFNVTKSTMINVFVSNIA